MIKSNFSKQAKQIDPAHVAYIKGKLLPCYMRIVHKPWHKDPFINQLGFQWDLSLVGFEYCSSGCSNDIVMHKPDRKRTDVCVTYWLIRSLKEMGVSKNGGTQQPGFSY